MERFEPVLDDGLGLPGDLAPDPLAVRAEPEADHAHTRSKLPRWRAVISPPARVAQAQRGRAPCSLWRGTSRGHRGEQARDTGQALIGFGVRQVDPHQGAG